MNGLFPFELLFKLKLIKSKISLGLLIEITINFKLHVIITHYFILYDLSTEHTV